MQLKLRINDRDVYVRSGAVLTAGEVSRLASDVVQDASSLHGVALAVELPDELCNRLQSHGVRHALYVGMSLTEAGTRILRLALQVEEMQLNFFLHAGHSRTRALLEAMRSCFSLLVAIEGTRQIFWCQTALDFKDAQAVLDMIATDGNPPTDVVRTDILAAAAADPAWLAPVSFIEGVDVGTSVVVVPSRELSVAPEATPTVH